MDNSGNKRLDYLFDLFNKQFKWACEKGVYLEIDFEGSGRVFLDSIFDRFFEETLDEDFREKICGSNSNHSELIFNFLKECDFSDNKRYLSWIISLYKKNLRDRLDVKLGYHDTYYNTSYNMYEDLYSKITKYLPYFDLIKKSKFFPEENRDINKYKSINEFIDKIRPYIVYEDTEEVDTLNNRETECILNYERHGKLDELIPGNGEIVFDNSKWIIVSTLDYKANLEFGKYTDWCTSKNKNTFFSYFRHGNLFVLIKKGFGSKTYIEKDPNNRLQFHFESSQFMNAFDKPIDLKSFFKDNLDIKNFFGAYLLEIVENIHKNSSKSTTDKSNWSVNIKYDKKDLADFLKKYGFIDLLLNLYAKERVKHFELSGIESGYLENCDFSVLCDLESIKFEKCDFEHIPSTLSGLKRLKKIEFKDVKNLIEIPEWISKLTCLEDITVTNSQITDISNLTKCSNMVNMTFGGNYGLKKLPDEIGNLKKLMFLTVSFCGLTEICDEIVNCESLTFLDLSYNKIKNFNFRFNEFPVLKVVNLDENKITAENLAAIKNNLSKDTIFIAYN